MYTALFRGTALSIPSVSAIDPDTISLWGNPYSYGPSGYDEFYTPQRNLRSHLKPFIDCIAECGTTEVQAYSQRVQELLRIDGVTYNVYGDPQGIDRLWQLDLLPLIVSSEEWSALSKGLVQRARLLNEILKDIYGPQRLLYERLLPAELIYSSPGFLRSCHKLDVPDGIYLHVYAVDLGRSPDGTWWVIGDRTQAPSGSGYALENRLIISRTLPDAFQRCRVQRLAASFHLFRENLIRLAPTDAPNPRIVVLTPGPFNETYFEHALLSRYLGFTLSEGGDLTVRDRKVYLKTLSGLQQVHVILRRQDDDFCDPLELRPDSNLGVPGLVDAVRAGNVVVANALGSGLLENPAFAAFTPYLCQKMLNETLLIPNLATWWCGQQEERAYALQHTDRLVFKQCQFGLQNKPYFFSTMKDSDRLRLLKQIEEKPFAYVGQETLRLSSMPVWNANAWVPRALVLRAYVFATEKGYLALPGGLTRFAPDDATLNVSMQLGGSSKDTWVLSDGPVSTFSLLKNSEQQIELSSPDADTPSRIADNLFWTGRYAERCEFVIRVFRGILEKIVDEVEESNQPVLPTLIEFAVGSGYLASQPDGAIHFQSLGQTIFKAMFDDELINSLANNLVSLRRATWVVRDRFSDDTWRVLNYLEQDLSKARRIYRNYEKKLQETGNVTSGLLHGPGDTLSMLNNFMTSLAAISGFSMEIMTRSHSWRFMEMGRRIERAYNLVRLLHATMFRTGPTERNTIDAVLDIVGARMTYRSRYRTSYQAYPMFDLLLADETNPRSLHFQLKAIKDQLDLLPMEVRQRPATEQQKVLLAMISALSLADIKALCEVKNGTRPELEQFLARFEEQLPRLSDLLGRSYLSHTLPTRQLFREK